MARGRNEIDTAKLRLSTTPLVVAYLKELVKTGFYGKNPAEAAERLVSATLHSMVDAGDLPKIDEATIDLEDAEDEDSHG